MDKKTQSNVAERRITHTVNDQPARIDLEATATGYRWKLSLAGSSFPEMLQEIEKADAQMRQKFGVARGQ